MATKKVLLVKNTMARLVTLDGVALIPGKVTEVPHSDVNKRDVDGVDGLEIVSSADDDETEETEETGDVLHPESPNAAQRAMAADDEAKQAKAAWKSSTSAKK